MVSRKRTILLVEDEALIALGEKRTLESSGYAVLVAATGEKAVELARTEPAIDLVLMDINLGRGIDGTQAAEMILADRELPIVFLSSHTEPAVVEKTERITSYGYIVKNSGDTVLITSIKMAFRLYESRKLVGDTFRYSINGVCIHRLLYDDTGRSFDCEYLRVNDAFEQHTGLSASSVVGKTIREIYPNDEANDIIDLYARVLTAEEPVRQEIYFKPTERWFELSIFPTRDDEFSVVLQNITERKLGERAIAAEKEWLNVTLQSIGDAVIATDTGGNVVLLNAVAERLTGWSKDKARGKPLGEVFEIVNAMTRRACENPVAKALREGEVVGLANHTLLISADGTEYQIADSAAPIKDAEGTIFGVVLVFRDVTEEYAMENALRESEGDMRRAQEMARVGSWRLFLDSGIVTASDETRGIYGVGGTELSIREVQTISLPQYREALDIALRDLIHAGTPYDLEFQICRPSDGVIRYIHSIAEYNAEQHMVFGTIQDITERKLEEEALKNERATLAMIMETSPVGIATVDAAGSITYANSTAEEILGLTREEITSRSYNAPLWNATTLDGEPLPDEKQPFFIVKTTRLPAFDIQHAITWPDNRRVILSVNGSPMEDENGRFSGMVAAIEDITDRVTAERKIQDLLTEKELLLQESHHRVMNNMNTVHSLLSLQANTMGGGTCSDLLADAAQRLQGMIRLYDRLYRHQNPDEMSIQDFLPPLLDLIIEPFHTIVPIRTSVRVEAFVLSARSLSTIGIIINELITNSVKHALTGMNDGLITMTAVRTDSRITITYEDNGPGLPHSTSFENTTGFGLQLVQMLAQQIQGSIRIERNGGTKYVLEIPE